MDGFFDFLSALENSLIEIVLVVDWWCGLVRKVVVARFRSGFGWSARNRCGWLNPYGVDIWFKQIQGENRLVSVVINLGNREPCC